MGLVLVAPGLSGYVFSGEHTLRWIQLVQAIEEDDGSPAGDVWLQNPYMLPAMERPAVAQRLQPIARENARSWLIHPLFPRDLFTAPAAIQRLSELQAPTLLILGDRDQPDIQSIVHTLETGVEGSQKVVIAEAGHLVNMEKAEEFNQTVLNFLAKD